jgi:adenosylcobinamide-phosphate synthase
MLSFAHYPTAPWIVLSALLLDQGLGELRRWHPLVGFGAMAQRIEAHAPRTKWAGLLGWCLLVLPPVFLCAWLLSALPEILRWALETVILYFTIGARSLFEHARAIATPLQQGDMEAARIRVGHIVSRDTHALDETGVAKATVESVLENGADAIFAPLFWFLLLGAPGALLYRLANTLDAMWGYRTARLLHFGWASARLDDLLNLIPARLTALSYCLVGHCRSGFQCWMCQGKTWYSPNAGPVMAAGAGALQVSLGGPATYHGEVKPRPLLGTGQPPHTKDIQRACQLVQRAMLLWGLCILVGGWIHA